MSLLRDRLSLLLSWRPAAPVLTDYPFGAAEVAQYHRWQAASAHALPDQLDDQTWDELLLPSYSARLAAHTSIHGQQLLHHRLRAGHAPPAALARLQLLAADAPRAARLQQACRDLRRSEQEVATTLFGSMPAPAPRWTRWLGALPLAFLLVLGAALASGVLLLWGLLLLLWVALLAVQVRYGEAAADWARSVASLQQLLRAHSLLALQDDALAAPLREGAVAAGRLNRRLERSPLEAVVPGAREYGDWLLLNNVRHYFATRALVRSEAAALRASFLLVAALEADLALARHLAGQARYCWTQPAAGAGLQLAQVVHPLLAQAAPLDVALGQQGAFISGQNGVGKSTLLRTLGLNLIVARAFGFCYAERAELPLLPVYASMQGEDTLEGGASLYQVELRRAQQLLALAAHGPALFIIDEIFRGTNHLESVSAAAAVLHTLAQSGRVIVSSHNLVLAPLLADCLQPWCVSAPGGAHAGLCLQPGVLGQTNGIALLAQRGFGSAIEGKAARVFDWLSAHMAQPQQAADVLAPPISLA